VRVLSETPLYYASHNGRVETVKLLIAAGADVNKVSAKCLTPLLAASRAGCVEVVKLLIAAGADFNLSQQSIFWASYEGHVEVVRLLIAAGADVNVCNAATYVNTLIYLFCICLTLYALCAF
jgi:uncharacterized protein